MKTTLSRISTVALASGIGVMAGLAALPAAAEEATLRAASSFALGTTFTREFERFVDHVNEEGEGLVQIDLIGGPEAIPPFEMGSAVSQGIIDLANASGAFYTNVLPLGDALKLAEISSAEMRENGAMDFIDELHREQMNVHYLARTGIGIPFHIYTTQPVDGPDLSDLRIRTTSTYRAFINALGGSPVQTAPGEVYTALERGVVDGYGWPAQGVLDLGWQEHTSYRVDPGFYNVDVSFLVNLDTWTGLSDEQRDFLTEAAVWTEAFNDENAEINQTEYDRQAEAGIEVITLEGEQAESWLDTAYRVGWEEAEEIDAENAGRLRDLIGDR
ncbi:TRAP transporter substrate-binding protein DctP [Fodinicurvata sp. EGI_FJ10296]|uniref:TRAP transporter substrate-binding protein DctP n=1 Tax=Fodinicurvata sp. EGI_FJ10296 TaxID=3231908 RepID=UPI0034532FF5